jgi:Protein of unknown function (DUF3750)
MSEFSVALWSTPMPWPISFAVHMWFVVTHAGVSDRYEVWAFRGKFNGSLIAKNAIALESGFRRTYFDDPINPVRTGPVTKLWEITGDSESLAAQLYYRVVTSAQVYQFNTFYRLWPGPNSNSYIAWCLAPYPELFATLPWNAFGKTFTKTI